ncbi:hypothetical protein B0H12DRAFT_1092874, partial [Mycena haematopus]
VLLYSRCMCLMPSCPCTEEAAKDFGTHRRCGLPSGRVREVHQLMKARQKNRVHLVETI